MNISFLIPIVFGGISFWHLVNTNALLQWGLGALFGLIAGVMLGRDWMKIQIKRDQKRREEFIAKAETQIATMRETIPNPRRKRK